MKKHEASNTYVESDAAAAKGTQRPFHDPGIGRFADRLKDAMAGEALRPFAKRSGISEGSIHSYLSGQTLPSLDRLDAICAATGRSAAWFVSDADSVSVGEPHAEYESHPLRVDLLTMAVELIDSELARAGRNLPLDKRALAYSLVYEELLEPGDELPTAKILKLVLRAV